MLRTSVNEFSICTETALIQLLTYSDVWKKSSFFNLCIPIFVSMHFRGMIMGSPALCLSSNLHLSLDHLLSLSHGSFIAFSL